MASNSSTRWLLPFLFTGVAWLAPATVGATPKVVLDIVGYPASDPGLRPVVQRVRQAILEAFGPSLAPPESADTDSLAVGAKCDLLQCKCEGMLAEKFPGELVVLGRVKKVDGDYGITVLAYRDHQLLAYGALRLPERELAAGTLLDFCQRLVRELVRPEGPKAIPKDRQRRDELAAADVPQACLSSSATRFILVRADQRKTITRWSHYQWFGMIGAGLGAATLGVGGVLVLDAYSTGKEADRIGCTGHITDCTNTDSLDKAQHAYDQAKRANWVVGAGVVLLGSGIAAYFLGPRGSQEWWPELMVTGDGASWRLTTRF